MIALTGLQDVARKRAGGFSLGMGQRLGIASALLGDPANLVLDEPVNGLDPEGVLWMRDLLRALAAEGRTVLLSSHLMSEMALTADHLIVIGRGRLIADVGVEELTGTHERVRLRTPDAGALAALLGENVTAHDGDRLEVTGLASDSGRRARAPPRAHAARADAGPRVARGGVHGAHARRGRVPGGGRMTALAARAGGDSAGGSLPRRNRWRSHERRRRHTHAGAAVGMDQARPRCARSS